MDIKKERHLTFEILSDPGNQVAKKFGLVFSFPDELRQAYMKFGLDIPLHNGDDSWTLPMPGRFVIDKNATILSAEVSPDYTIRPELEETLKTLTANN